jgi:hypothetical protein
VIDPIIGLLRFEQMPLESQVFLLGIAYEALGYLLYIEDGKSESQAEDSNFLARVRKIHRTINDIAVPFNLKGWEQDFSDCYNTIKHINKGEYDYDKCFKVTILSSAMIRIWIARKLGCRKKELESRIRGDKLCKIASHIN